MPCFSAQAPLGVRVRAHTHTHTHTYTQHTHIAGCTSHHDKRAGIKWISGSRFSSGVALKQLAHDYERRLRLRTNTSLPLVYLDVGIKGQTAGRWVQKRKQETAPRSGMVQSYTAHCKNTVKCGYVVIWLHVCMRMRVCAFLGLCGA